MQRNVPVLTLSLMLLAMPGTGWAQGFLPQGGSPNAPMYPGLPPQQPGGPAPPGNSPFAPSGPMMQGPSMPAQPGGPNGPGPMVGSPPQPGFGPQQPGFGPQQPGNGTPPGGRQNLADELTDFGVPPQAEMQPNVGSPTPTTIPGAHVITTAEMPRAVQGGVLVIDVLEGPPHPQIPGSIWMPGAGRAGSFDDQTQQQLWTALSQATQMRAERPIAFLCLGSRCWESYNAALRAVHMGFKTVLWYRGGLLSWQAAGLPLNEAAQGQGAPQQPSRPAFNRQ